MLLPGTAYGLIGDANFVHIDSLNIVVGDIRNCPFRKTIQFRAHEVTLNNENMVCAQW